MGWFLRIIGVSDEFIAHLDRVTLSLQRPGLFWAGCALLVPVGIYVFRRQQRNLTTVPGRLRLVLSAVRVLILLLLVLVLGGPYLRLDHQIEKKPIVAVLLDQSQSMQLPVGQFADPEQAARMAKAAGIPVNNKLNNKDGPDDQTGRKLAAMSRSQLAHAVLQGRARKLLESLADNYDLRYYTFDRAVRPLSVDAEHLELPPPPEIGGDASHLGEAIAAALDEAAGRQMAGLLVFSDGQNTGGLSPAQAAYAADKREAPVFAVPVGSPVRLRDVAIVDVFTSGIVSVDDTAQVAVTIESQGFDGQTAKIELRDGQRLRDTQELVLRGSEQQRVELSFVAKQPGTHYLTVRVLPLPGEPEALRSNNADTALLRVTDAKIAVLYVEGLPRWDFRFLKNAMRRDHGLSGADGTEPDIVLEAELRRQPAGHPTGLPRSAASLGRYRTVILGDVSPKLLDGTFLSLLDKAVRERGLGLIVAAGPNYMPHAYGTPLRELLPVSVSAGRPGTGGIEAPAYKPFHVEITPQGAVHEALRLYDNADRNQQAWSRMPPYYWCAAVDRPSPAATVLAWNPDQRGRYGKMPLIAYQYAGAGKVLFVGTDATWRWRQNVGDRYFYKFWGQAIRLVARRDETGAKKSWIVVRPIHAQPGHEASIELMAMTKDGAPNTRRSMAVQVHGPRGVQVVQLTADPASPGRYTGKFMPQVPGTHRVVFAGSGQSPAEARIQVRAPTEELRHPNVNRPALELLASASGGKLVELPDLASIPDQLRGQPKRIQLHREATVWDNWFTLALLMFLYCLDVGIRRLTGLS